MAREYVISADLQTVVAAAPIIVFMNPVAAGAAGCGFEVLRVWASQRANATSAQTGFAMGTKLSVFPTVVSATPAKLKLSDPVSSLVGGTAGAAGTCGVNASANGAGTAVAVISDNFNNLNGYLWVPTPNETFVLMPGSTSGFFAQLTGTVAPASTPAWSFGVVYREIG